MISPCVSQDYLFDQQKKIFLYCGISKLMGCQDIVTIAQMKCAIQMIEAGVNFRKNI